MSVEIEIPEAASAVAEEEERTSYGRIDVEKLEDIKANGIRKLNSSQAMCIFKVPECLKDLKEEVYIPKVVGLGPFHHEVGTLPYLKEYKMEAVLRNLIKIYPGLSLGDGLEKLTEEVKGLEKQIQDCYQFPFPFDPDVFILDSCFLLEFLFPYRLYKQDCFSYPSSYDWDNIYSATSLSIERDLRKLENQIPIILLRRLLHLQRSDESARDILFRMAWRLFCPSMVDILEMYSLESLRKIGNSVRHFLEYGHQVLSHLLREAACSQCSVRPEEVQKECCLGWFSAPPQNDNIMCSWSFPGARELEKVGIEIRSGDILSFHEKWYGLKGVLTIPPIQIDDNMEAFIRNIVAFEECLPIDERLVAAFMELLNCLVGNGTGVEILREAHIINHFFTNDQVVADIISSININAPLSPVFCNLVSRLKHSYSSSWRVAIKQFMETYISRPSRVMIKEFMHTHIAKPWLLIGTLGAMALLALTIVQTIYTVKSYKHGN